MAHRVLLRHAVGCVRAIRGIRPHERKPFTVDRSATGGTFGDRNSDCPWVDTNQGGTAETSLEDHVTVRVAGVEDREATEMPELPIGETPTTGDVESVAASLAQAGGRGLLAVLAAFVALRVIKRVINRVDEHRLREQLLFFIPKVVWVTAALIGLAAVGIDVTGMAAVMATVGFTGAVVFTPVGQNLVAGAMIRIDHIYRVGEVVTIGDLHGIVLYRSMLRTELALPDGSTAWVPNSLFQENQVLNHSRLGAWRVCVQVPVDRFEDRRRAVKVMEQVVAELPWSPSPHRPFVAFDHVGSEAMFFSAYAWIEDRTQEPYYRGLLLDALVDALEDAGVSVGQTTNLAIREQGRHKRDDRPHQ